jgi:2-keto-4-pentenoate hydratase/2-oxohepta-3-ene-1,7-dioic acid hydratase in catechol pathway
MGVLRPPLTILEPDEFALLDRLDLRLSVNDVVRWDITASLVFKAAETISELSTLADIAPRDVLLTGTPSCCALRVPPAVRRLLGLLPERRSCAPFPPSRCPST